MATRVEQSDVMGSRLARERLASSDARIVALEQLVIAQQQGLLRVEVKMDAILAELRQRR